MIVEILGNTYPELEKNYEKIVQVIRHEDERYKDLLKTTRTGLRKIQLNNLTIDDVIDFPGFIAGYKELESKLAKSPGTQILSGEMMYRLHRTYGFDEELLLKIAAARDLIADIESFDKILKEAKEISKNMLYQVDGCDVRLETMAPTENRFKYNYQFNRLKQIYEVPSVKAKIVAIQKDSTEKGVFHIVTDKSNFYFEAGGQECDNGKLVKCSSGETVFQVNKVNFENGIVIHSGVFLNGMFDGGDMVELFVDEEKRTGTIQHHTGKIFFDNWNY